MDQPKVERMLRLMKMLSGSVNYSIDEIADMLGMSRRTIYRYIDTLRSAGFALNKIGGDCYKLCRLPKDAVEIDKLVYFSEEEAYLVNSLIDSLVPSNSLKSNLKQKLSAVYKSTAIADFVGSRSNAAKVEVLGRCIEDRSPALLKGYESGNSHTVRDRHVEPFAFSSDYTDIWAYDLGDGRNKTFRLSRMAEAVALEGEWKHEKEHRKAPSDVFRMTSGDTTRVVLRLSVYAKNLLVEEYPLAGRELTENADGSWTLDTKVCAMKGIGRFVCGLPGEISIVEGEELREYVRDCAAELMSISSGDLRE